MPRIWLFVLWLRWSGVKNGGQKICGICEEARSLMHQDNGVPSQQHRPTEETAKLENTTASNGKSSSAPSAPSSNQSSTAQSTLASQTTSGSVSRDKRSLEVSRRRRQSSAKSTTSSSSSSVGKLDSSKDANQTALARAFLYFYQCVLTKFSYCSLNFLIFIFKIAKKSLEK